jgi:hypothetical protein
VNLARAFDRRPGLTASRVAIVVLVAAVLALAAGAFAAPVTRADAPTKWRPFLMKAVSDVRPAGPPADGSDVDRRDLDEIVALQKSPPSSLTTAITYWGAQPSPTRWNEILLSLVRTEKINPVRVSRAIALLNAAMYDAVLAACDAKLAYRRSGPAQRDARIRATGGPDDISSYASADAAIAAAARTILSSVFPGDADTFAAAADEVERVRLATGMNTRSDIAAGEAIGLAVGKLAVQRAKSDGSTAIFRGSVPEFPGAWAPAKPFANTLPDEPMAGTWTPWLMTSPSQFRPEPPPAFKSAAWQADADEVVRVANNLTDEQFAIARFWADGAGTDTPPGHWVRFAITMGMRDRLSTPAFARVLAYLGTAEADAFIASWDAKYTYWSGRPIGLIPGFASTIITPNFPSYISGHATVSGAAAAVLGAFFPSDAGRLRAQAEEAAMSRLYAGIHWRSDNETGLRVGREIAAAAVARATADGSLR